MTLCIMDLFRLNSMEFAYECIDMDMKGFRYTEIYTNYICLQTFITLTMPISIMARICIHVLCNIVR